MYIRDACFLLYMGVVADMILAVAVVSAAAGAVAEF